MQSGVDSHSDVLDLDDGAAESASEVLDQVSRAFLSPSSIVHMSFC